MAKQYRKKPVVIEAMQFQTWGDIDDIMEWCPSVVIIHGKELSINMLESNMRADLGDWIIRGVAGEFYPCKPDIFKQTYEPVP